MASAKAIAAVLGAVLLSCSPPSYQARTDLASGGTPQSLKGIAVRWRPVATQGAFDMTRLSLYDNVRFVILPVTDARTDGELIGTAVEDKRIQNTTVPVSTRTDMAAWWTEGMVSSLKLLGIDASRKGKGIVIEAEITGINVAETFSYKSDLSMRLSVRTSDEMLVWEGTTQGSSEIEGPPYNHQTYSECLSNGLVNLVYNLLTDRSFSAAMDKAF